MRRLRRRSMTARTPSPFERNSQPEGARVYIEQQMTQLDIAGVLGPIDPLDHGKARRVLEHVRLLRHLDDVRVSRDRPERGVVVRLDPEDRGFRPELRPRRMGLPGDPIGFA